MIFRLSSLSRILAVLVLLVAVMPAQSAEGEGDLTPDQIKAMRSARIQKGQLKKGESDAEREARWAAMTPDERLDANKRRGSKAHCRFVATCRPPKLLPGQSGVMLVTAILQGQAVLPAPLSMTMSPRVKPNSVQIGTLIAHEAMPGTMAKAYLGRPVYENTAVFEVPVTMGTNAKLGEKTPVAVDLQFDIYHGDSGQAIGRFIERVSTDVEVAAHVDPQVAGRVSRPKAEPKRAPVVPTPVTNSVKTSGDDSDSDAAGPKGKVIPVQGPAEPAPEVTETETEESGDLPSMKGTDAGLPWMLILGGGGFLLVIVLLLLRKK